jgi:hypothetical protein
VRRRHETCKLSCLLSRSASVHLLRLGKQITCQFRFLIPSVISCKFSRLGCSESFARRRRSPNVDRSVHMLTSRVGQSSRPPVIFCEVPRDLTAAQQESVDWRTDKHEASRSALAGYVGI